MTQLEYIMILCTCPDQSSASRLANLLVEQRLAACVNIIGQLTSIYRWQDKIEQTQEHLLLIKSTMHHLETIQTSIKQNHPYELPEIIAVPIVAGLDAYLCWLRDSTLTSSRGIL